MSKKKRGQVTARLVASKMRALEDAHVRQVEKMALDVWKKVVVPACKKHGIEFRSGMGTYLLTDAEGRNIYDSRDAARRGLKIKKLFGVLDIAFGTQPIGSLMPDFVPESK